MNEIDLLVKIKVAREIGIRDGLRFAVSTFLCGFTPSIEEELYQKAIEFLVREYYSQDPGDSNV